MKIVIIDYGAGNIKSIQFAFKRLGYEAILTSDAKIIKAADKVIFPGVGEASTAMKYLKERGLDEVIKSVTQPFLGICLGLQLMCNKTEEGKTNCLGIFDTSVKLFPPKEKVPHIGWNSFYSFKGKLFNNINTINDVYYVHSYYAELNKDTVAICDYINPFSAALQNANFYATQFHPEKSAGIGEQILKNFLEL